MKTQKQALTEALNDRGVKADLWEKHGFTRIYLGGFGKDIKAYIELDEPESAVTDDLWCGARLSVRSRAAAPDNWLLNREKQIRHAIMIRLSESQIVDCKVCDDWRDVIS